jgi:histidine triad (HIT) family protein
MTGMNDPNDPCVFCHPKTLLDNEAHEVQAHPITIYRTVPRGPVVPGHRVYFPLVHVPDSLTQTQVTAWTVAAALDDTRRFKYDYFNLIINNGEWAGQTVNHLHVHIVPRGPGPDSLKMPWPQKWEGGL